MSHHHPGLLLLCAGHCLSFRVRSFIRVCFDVSDQIDVYFGGFPCPIKFRRFSIGFRNKSFSAFLSRDLEQSEAQITQNHINFRFPGNEQEITGAGVSFFSDRNFPKQSAKTSENVQYQPIDRINARKYALVHTQTTLLTFPPTSVCRSSSSVNNSAGLMAQDGPILFMDRKKDDRANKVG